MIPLDKDQIASMSLVLLHISCNSELTGKTEFGGGGSSIRNYLFGNRRKWDALPRL